VTKPSLASMIKKKKEKKKEKKGETARELTLN
jgi:hypothetical protein